MKQKNEKEYTPPPIGMGPTPETPEEGYEPYNDDEKIEDVDEE